MNMPPFPPLFSTCRSHTMVIVHSWPSSYSHPALFALQWIDHIPLLTHQIHLISHNFFVHPFQWNMCYSRTDASTIEIANKKGLLENQRKNIRWNNERHKPKMGLGWTRYIKRTCWKHTHLSTTCLCRVNRRKVRPHNNNKKTVNTKKLLINCKIDNQSMDKQMRCM